MKPTADNIKSGKMCANNRRSLLKAIAAMPLLAGVLSGSVLAKSVSGAHKTFILVHGAWHGAWCWRDVRVMLEAQGHRVFTPTLTGMGERHHLSSASVDLNTHIRDVAAVLECEELNDVVLVGHSYAGYIVNAVANTMPNRVSAVVYLDALLPVVGKAARDSWPPEQVAGVEKSLIDGFKLASFPPEMFDVPPSDKVNYAWLQRRLTDMPYNVFKTPFPEVPADNAAAVKKIKFTYIKCSEAKLDGPKYSLEQARAEKMSIVTLKTGHNPMVTAPKMLVDSLAKIVGAGRRSNS
jgi:pimeloyl-ACP methyl ester carboxylesterase